MKEILKKWNDISLVKRIICGLAVGILLGVAAPQLTALSLLGDLFVGALKAVAPLLVLFLVMGALSNHKEGKQTNMKSIIGLYLLGTFLAGCVAVVASFLFPISLTLAESASDVAPPGGIGEVLHTLMMNLVSNPISALANANYIGILAWAVLLGIALRKASDGTKRAIGNVADAISQIVRWIINCAPFGVMGLVFTTISEQGIDALLSYGKLILLLVGSMAFVAFIVNPIIAFIGIRKPLSAGAEMPEGQRHHRFLYAQLGRQHSGQYEAVRGAGAGPRYLCGIHPAGFYDQHGRRGGHDLHTRACRGAYHGHRGGSGVRDRVERALRGQRVRRIRRGGRLAAVGPAGLQPVRHSKRYRDAGSGCRFYRRRDPGFLRNRDQFLDRRAVYRGGGVYPKA